MPIRRIDDQQIDSLVQDARSVCSRANVILDRVLINGIEHTLTLPGLYPMIKRFTGDTLIVRSRVAPVSAAAVPPSDLPPA